MILLAGLAGRIPSTSLTRESGCLNPHGASGDLSKISAQDARWVKKGLKNSHPILSGLVEPISAHTNGSTG